MNNGVCPRVDKKAGRVLIDGGLRLVEVLRVHIAEFRAGSFRGLSDRSSLSVLVRLDNRDIFQSSSSPKSHSLFGDDFVHEVSGTFSQVHFLLFDPTARLLHQRALARVSLRKRDVIRYAGRDMWFPLKAMGRHGSDVKGQLCVELEYERAKPDIAIRVLDHSGLKVSDSTELYVLITVHGTRERVEPRKLRICKKDKVDECVVIPLSDLVAISPDRNDNDTRCQLRIGVWHDVLAGLNSYFHGEIRIQLDATTMKPRIPSQGVQWYYLKPRLSVDSPDALCDHVPEDSPPTASSSRTPYGELRMKLMYTAEHILPMGNYEQLRALLITSLQQRPFATTAIGILEMLPLVDMETVARPLMKIFVQADLIRPLLRLLCTHEISKCQEDVNTMFRSRSLASKVLYELMKFVGHQYLVISLKPVIDLIYREAKCCEIDPCKLRDGECLDENMAHLHRYAETAFSRVVDSNHRCPPPLRDVFGDLRAIVNDRYPQRVDVQRLALSSFLIMRFFAAAILNPKLFGLKRENADGHVARTLVLVSKILQRLANCVVSTQALTIKEQWLSPILLRFTDEPHRLAMVKFLDRVSLVGGENSISGDSMSLLRDGVLLEKTRPRRKRCLKNLLRKRRYVMLTETELLWHKSKAHMQPKGRLTLSEVNALEIVDESGKYVFRVATPNVELNLQAANAIDMNEWLSVLQRQVKRQVLVTRRTTQLSQLYDVDVERELEAVHMAFVEHAEALKHWKNALEGSAEIPDGQVPLPEIAMTALANEEEREDCPDQEVEDMGDEHGNPAELLYRTLQGILGGALMIEKAHKVAVNTFMNQLRSAKGTRENPIDGDDNYLLLKSRMQKAIE